MACDHGCADDERYTIDGKLLGIIPLGRRFEFEPDGASQVIKGQVGEQFSESYLERMSTEQFAGKRWRAPLHHVEVTRQGREPSRGRPAVRPLFGSGAFAGRPRFAVEARPEESEASVRQVEAVRQQPGRKDPAGAFPPAGRGLPARRQPQVDLAGVLAAVPASRPTSSPSGRLGPPLPPPPPSRMGGEPLFQRRGPDAGDG